jgi:hypothetical protein
MPADEAGPAGDEDIRHLLRPVSGGAG